MEDALIDFVHLSACPACIHLEFLTALKIFQSADNDLPADDDDADELNPDQLYDPAEAELGELVPGLHNHQTSVTDDADLEQHLELDEIIWEDPLSLEHDNDHNWAQDRILLQLNDQDIKEAAN